METGKDDSLGGAENEIGVILEVTESDFMLCGRERARCRKKKINQKT
jgi:hypothetical protein